MQKSQEIYMFSQVRTSAKQFSIDNYSYILHCLYEYNGPTGLRQAYIDQGNLRTIPN